METFEVAAIGAADQIVANIEAKHPERHRPGKRWACERIAERPDGRMRPGDAWEIRCPQCLTLTLDLIQRIEQGNPHQKIRLQMVRPIKLDPTRPPSMMSEELTLAVVRELLRRT